MSKKNINIYEMGLNDSLQFDYDAKVRRVPGGWVYTTYTHEGVSSSFVPFNKEFKIKTIEQKITTLIKELINYFTKKK